MIPVLFCGSRDWNDPEPIRSVLAKLDPAKHLIVHGACRGADRITDDLAREMGFSVDFYQVRQDIDGRWPGAGPRRNRRMCAAAKPARVVAFPHPGPESPEFRGTRDMVRVALGAGVPTRGWRDGRLVEIRPEDVA